MTAATSKVRDWQDARFEAARQRLRESVGQADTLEAIREIVTGLLGCEEIGIFTVDQGKSRLFWSFGIDAMRHKTLDSFEDSARERAMQGEFHMVQASCEQRGNNTNVPLRVFVPIRMNGRTVAVLVMLKLLPQKIAFDESDVRLVTLLSNETGRALFDACPKRLTQRGETDE